MNMTPLEIYNISPVTYCHEPYREPDFKKELTMLKRQYTKRLNENKSLRSKNNELLAHLNNPPDTLKDNTYTIAENVKKMVADYYNIEVSAMAHKTRKKEIVLARHVSNYLIKKNTKLTLKSIGELFNRDHTTVMASIQTVKDLMWSDPQIKNDVDYLQGKI